MNSASELSRDHDVQLWQRVLEDERAAFEEVVVKYQNLVASVAFSATGNFALSEEVTQETFWQAWRQRFQLREPGRLAAWLCGIARNQAIQTSKKEYRQLASALDQEPGSSMDDPALSCISAEERQLVWQTLEGIPETYREALVLFYREGHSISEVALALEVSTDVAKQRVHRGRELLRASLAKKVEDVLMRSRPGRALTSRVMVGLAALGASLKATSLSSAATVGTASVTEAAKAAVTNSVGAVAASAVKSAVVTGTGAGVLGGLLGAAGGLGGAFLGCWLPGQMAETMAERRLLEKQGRRAFVLAIVYTAAMLLATPLLFITKGLVWYFGSTTLVSLAFTVCVVVLSRRAQAELKQLRASLKADAELNSSPLRRKIGLERVVYRGRRYTSRWSFLGVPLIDIQLSDAFVTESRSAMGPVKAFGWIAVGDRATGLLFAVGGIAKGLIAVGGLAVGGFAIGGGTIGACAIGGGALGVMAIGGGAVGYDAVGGLAVAWHAASGGGAIAYHLAVGGGAWAYEYAVGGAAWAIEANTAAARQLADVESKMWIVEWIAKNQLLFMVVTALISLLPVALLKFAYRREVKNDL